MQPAKRGCNISVQGAKDVLTRDAAGGRGDKIIKKFIPVYLYPSKSVGNFVNYKVYPIPKF